MTVTQATRADLGALLALETHFETQWSAEAWSAELDGADRRVLLIRADDGTPAGAACLQLAGDVADLHRIVVAENHRRRGLASAMLAAGLAWARRRGAARVLLEVDDTNEPAIALYRGHGFHPISRREHYYGTGRHAVVMQRRLTARAPEGDIDE